tara:strand:+ start:80 stop:550 length:471 start_codon:yes stop_codon:yes gene_type:complete
MDFITEINHDEKCCPPQEFFENPQEFFEARESFKTRNKMAISNRTEYLENKYLGKNAIIKKPIRTPLPYLDDIKNRVRNEEYNLRGRFAFTYKPKCIGVEWCYHTTRYTNKKYKRKELEKIIDKLLISCYVMTTKTIYFSSKHTKKDLWKIIMKYD